jgi:hypothetical protein
MIQTCPIEFEFLQIKMSATYFSLSRRFSGDPDGDFG